MKFKNAIGYVNATNIIHISMLVFTVSSKMIPNSQVACSVSDYLDYSCVFHIELSINKHVKKSVQKFLTKP